ncbi:hypothetical protein [Caballeronia sp. LZ001]|uniref:hypothetical protein n=1 Tax=Caballeronia sp. LZ001 TaxID=3038553 RepID=UPI00285B3EB6|nr:hypothetical protein [Caballeronia sp. LZ001]MDR5802719.1 hypothetical protein [Caballeronia sp. LZ001]
MPITQTMPRYEYTLNGWPMLIHFAATLKMPMRGAPNRIHANAPMNGGMKIGMAAARSRKPRHGTLVRTRHHASMTPSAVASSMEPSAMTSVLPIAIQ